MPNNKILDFLKSKEVSDMFSEYGVTDAYVFGSYLRGTQKKGSDLDLMIKNDRSKYRMTIVDYVNIEKFFKEKIGVSNVDIGTRSSIKKIFMPFIEKELIRIK